MHRACYDLAKNPPTYDAVAFAVQVVEQFGGEPVTITIAPGPKDGFRDDNLWPQNPGARGALLHDVLIPILEMVPNATVCSDTLQDLRAGFGANQYTIPWRHFVRCNAKGIRSLRPRPRPNRPRNPKLITITLREAEHWPQRNSNLPEWLKAASFLEHDGYMVVFVRDTCKSNRCLPLHAPTNILASWDLHSRAALYRSAACNMFVSNGPAWLSMACDAPTLVLKPTCEELGRCYDSAWFKRCGIEPGGQFPNTAPHHELVWMDDTAENITTACDRFMRYNYGDMR